MALITRGLAPVALVTIVGLAAVGALFGPQRAPAPGRETTLWLAVESRVKDGDLQMKGDAARFRERFASDPRELLLREQNDVEVLDAPWAWTELAAAARKLGRGGPYALSGALLGLAATFAIATLAGRLGLTSAILLVAVAYLGSPAFQIPFRLEPLVLELAAIACAAWLVWHRRSEPALGLETVYSGSKDDRPSALRWAPAGAAFGVALAASPAYLPLALPLWAAAPKERRTNAGALFTLFAGAAFGALFFFGGSPWEPFEPIASLDVFFWSGIGSLLGRGVGLLPYFVPLALLVANSGRGDGRGWSYGAASACLLLQLVLSPYDFVSGSLAPGNGWFLPVYALLLASCEAAQSRGWTLATLVAAAPFLAPAWLAPLGPNPVAREAARRSAVAVDLLPLASTLRRGEAAHDLVRPELVVRGYSPGIRAAKRGGLELAEQRGTLLLVSNRPLATMRVELGGEAPAEIQPRGGEVANTTFRPNGDVAFDLVLPKRPRRHPVWWSREGAWLYEIQVRTAKRPVTPLPLDVPFASPIVPDAQDALRRGRKP